MTYVFFNDSRIRLGDHSHLFTHLVPEFINLLLGAAIILHQTADHDERRPIDGKEIHRVPQEGGWMQVWDRYVEG